MATPVKQKDHAAAASHTPAAGKGKDKEPSEKDKKVTAAAAKALAAKDSGPQTGAKRKHDDEGSNGAAAASSAKKPHEDLDLVLPKELQADLTVVMDKIVYVTTPGVFGEAGIRAHLLVPSNRAAITESEEAKRLVASKKYFAIAESVLTSPKKDLYITALKKLASLAKEAGAFTSEKEVAVYVEKRNLFITPLKSKKAELTPEQHQAVIFCERYTLKREIVIKQIHKETPLEFLDAIIDLIETAAKKGVKA